MVNSSDRLRQLFESLEFTGIRNESIEIATIAEKNTKTRYISYILCIYSVKLGKGTKPPKKTQ